MPNTDEIKDMTELIEILNSNVFQEHYFFVTIYKEKKCDLWMFEEPEKNKYNFGMKDADNRVNIIIFKDKGEIECDHALHPIPVLFEPREQESLTNENRIIKSLECWLSNFKG